MLSFPELPDIGKVIHLFAGCKAWPPSFSFHESSFEKKRNVKH
jgi:hypothetical protein